MTDERRLVDALTDDVMELGCLHAVDRREDDPCLVEVDLVIEAIAKRLAALPQPATEPALDGHEDDGEGGCVVCRVWERGSEDVYFRIPFPCPTARLAAQPSAEVERLRAALLHATMRRHDFSAGCDGCLNVQRETRAALDR